MGKKLLQPLTKIEPQAQLKHSVWFEFIDGNGRAHCETDYLLFLANRIYVFEVKLTQTPRGLSQLEELYLPVVRKVFQHSPVFGVMICKTLFEDTKHLATSWTELKSHDDPEELMTWHWLGR